MRTTDKRIAHPPPPPGAGAAAGQRVGVDVRASLLLHPGTPTDMLLDMLLGTAPRALLTNDRGYVVGQDHHRAKLTDHDVFLILELRAEHVGCAAIAEKFDISVHTVRSISAGRRRAHTATGQKQRT